MITKNYNAYKQENSTTADYFNKKINTTIILALVASVAPGNVLLWIIISLLDQLLCDLVIGLAEPLHQRIVLYPLIMG